MVTAPTPTPRADFLQPTNGSRKGEPVWDIALTYPPQGFWSEDDYLALPVDSFWTKLASLLDSDRMEGFKACALGERSESSALICGASENAAATATVRRSFCVFFICLFLRGRTLFLVYFAPLIRRSGAYPSRNRKVRQKEWKGSAKRAITRMAF